MRWFCLVVFSLLLTSCFSPQKSEVPLQTASIQSIRVMTFNVENLFDTKDDPGKKDETFLPLSLKKSKGHKKACEKYPVKKWKQQCLYWDWSEEVLNQKLERLAKVIKQVNEGKGPEVVMLQEVENLGVLKRLVEQELSDLSYRPVLIEGNDLRGIDVAILTRLKVIGTPVLHEIPFEEIDAKRKQDTRGILQVDLDLGDGTVLSTFTVHFPAPFHPVKYREQALKYLNKLKRQLPEERLVIAAGDFNIPLEEETKTGILKNFAFENWLVSHHSGCKGCKGTNYYPPKNSWSFLDMIFLSKNLTSKESAWQADLSSIRIANKISDQVDGKGYPQSFEVISKKGKTQIVGVSDHWPVVVDLKYQK